MGTRQFLPRRRVAVLICIAVLFTVAMGARSTSAAQDGPRVGQWTKGKTAVVESVAAIMARQAKVNSVVKPPKAKIEREFMSIRRNNPNSPLASKGGTTNSTTQTPSLNVVQTVGTEFTGATGGGSGADSPFVPPDTDGSAGPTQYIVGVNGRIRSFNKTTGVADGALDVDPDVFFGSLSSAGVSDPLVKYDRLSGRWFITGIDVANNDNMVVIGVSDGSTVTSQSSFNFFGFVQSVPLPTGDTSCFFDYPTTGIDATSLIIGGNQFCDINQDFFGSDVYLVKKSSILGVGPIEVAAFHDLTTGSHQALSTESGITTARGLDSWDATQTESYFIGDDNALYGLLNFRRITYPGGVPTLSANITITVAQTSLPISNQHLGNAGGGAANGLIDGNDMRIMPSYIVGGKLYATQGVSVNSSGVAQGATAGDRNAVRWYVFNNLTGTPAVEQFGTIYDNAGTNPLSYTYGSMRVTGQGHIVYGMTSLGVAQYPSAAYTGRLASDTAGTTSAPVTFEAGVGAYNSFDVNFGRPRRWGDYTTMSLDPCDDQTVWAAQEFVAVGGATNGSARWGVRIAQIKAPPPAALSAAVPNTVAQGLFNQNITITGTSSSGSAFFDTPATNNDPCRKRLLATVGNGVTVNSVTYNSDTSLTLNITTFGATTGAATVTITNPDGQQSSGAILTITSGTAVVTPTPTSTASNTPTVTATFTPTITPTATNTPISSSCPATLTNSSPTFNRPLTGNPPTGLSGTGTNVFYRAMNFTVNTSGTYVITFTNPALSGSDPNDGFYVLYSPNFNPASPLTNALVAIDDVIGTAPQITRALTTGTQYVLVSTTFDNAVTGTFDDVIEGPALANWCGNTVATVTPTATNTSTQSATPVPPRPDTIGVYKNGQWYLRNSNSTGAADLLLNFGGAASDIPIVGDWNGDGIDTVGVYRSNVGQFILSDSNVTPAENYRFTFGNPGDAPFAGRWTNAITHDGVGVYRNSNGILYQKNVLSTGFDDAFAIFGNPGDRGFAGDWEGNGFDSIGVYRNSNQTWYLSNNSTPSGITFSDYNFTWDVSTNAPVIGDWDGNIVSTTGYFNASNGVFALNNVAQAAPGSQTVFAFGPTGGVPVAGKWIAGSRPPISGLVPGNGSEGHTNEGGNGVD